MRFRIQTTYNVSQISENAYYCIGVLALKEKKNMIAEGMKRL